MKKDVYKKISIKKSSQKSRSSEFVTEIKENIETPLADIIFCSVVKPIYFSGSAVPRFKIQLELDPEKKEHKDFLTELESLATEWEVQVLGKLLEDGKISLSFQGKQRPVIKMVQYGQEEAEHIELEHDLPPGFKCKINFNLKKYVDRHSKKNAFTFPPNEVIFYLDEENQKIIEVEDGDCEDCGD